jgi:ATP-dependent DNA helicase RecQ
LWDYADVATRRFLIDGPRREKANQPVIDPAEIVLRKANEHRRLQEMIAYAEGSGCLRAAILRYFGDPAVRDRCDGCGRCRPYAIDAHERGLVLTILNAIVQCGERYGRRRIVAMLAGDTSDLPPALIDCEATGALAREQQATIERWLDGAITSGLVAVSNDRYRTLSLTPHGREVRSGRSQPPEIVAPRPAPRAMSGRHADGYDDLFFDERQFLRRRWGRF